MTSRSSKNVFFGLQAMLPSWVSDLPKGRMVPPKSRHMTVAFLGNLQENMIQAYQERLPNVHKIAPTGISNRMVFLPEKDPKVAAVEIELMTEDRFVFGLSQSLQGPHSSSSFLPHVTLARMPFHKEDWKQWFFPFPVIFPKLCLYISEGDLTYKSLAEINFIPPFTEMQHTADLAMTICGKNYPELAFHALLSLAFMAPEMLEGAYIPSVSSLIDVIAFLNQKIAILDRKFGLPFKAVTHSGNVEEKEHYLQWEMIVDV